MFERSGPAVLDATPQHRSLQGFFRPAGQGSCHTHHGVLRM